MYWGHVVLHAATLLQLHPTLLNANSWQVLLARRIPNVSHLKIFGCRVWARRLELQRKTIAAQREEGIYVGFDSPSILRYIIPSTSVLLRARFQSCIFEETVFPRINSPKNSPTHCFRALETLTLNPDPRAALAETEVQKILNLQSPSTTPSGLLLGRTSNHEAAATRNRAHPFAPKVKSRSG